MWIAIVLTIFVAYAAGIALGSLIERNHWERALAARAERIGRRAAAGARRARLQLIEGGRADVTQRRRANTFDRDGLQKDAA